MKCGESSFILSLGGLSAPSFHCEVDLSEWKTIDAIKSNLVMVSEQWLDISLQFRAKQHILCPLQLFQWSEN